MFSDTDKSVDGAEKGQFFEVITMAKYHLQKQHRERNLDISVCSSAYKQKILMFKKVFSDISFVFLLLAHQALSAKGHVDRSVSTEMVRESESHT